MLRNKSKNKIIAEKTRICKSIFSKSKGLMFTSKNAVKNRALVFVFKSERKVPLHMLFVFYPIDIIFLSSKRKVVETATLKPFQLNYSPSAKSMFVVECSKGSLKKANVSIGDIIEF